MDMKYYMKYFLNTAALLSLNSSDIQQFAKVSSNSRFCDSGVIAHFLLMVFLFIKKKVVHITILCS